MKPTNRFFSRFCKTPEDLYRTFSKHTFDHAAEVKGGVYVHPNVKRMYLDKVHACDFQELASAIKTFKDACHRSLVKALKTKKDLLFGGIADKDQVATQLLHAFADIGFDPNYLKHLSPFKEKIWRHYLEALPKSQAVEHTSKAKGVHVFGCQFDLNFLSWVQFFYQHDQTPLHLWLLDHGAYPAWLKPPEKEISLMIKRINQFTYTHKSSSVAALLYFLKEQDPMFKVGILIDDPKQQEWFAHQCALEDIKHAIADGFEGQAFSVMIGSLSELCSFDFDTVYLLDFFEGASFGSLIWTPQERRALAHHDVLMDEHNIKKRFLNQLISQTQTLYYVYDQHTTLPHLYHHPLEVADPMETMPARKRELDFNFAQAIQDHQELVNMPAWPVDEIYHPRENRDHTLSATDLTRMATCPRQYFFASQLKAARKPSDPRIFKVNGLAYGKMLHGFLEHVFESVKQGQDIELSFKHEKIKALRTIESDVDPAYYDIFLEEVQAVFDAMYTYVSTYVRTLVETELLWQEGPSLNTQIDVEGDVSWKGQMDRVDQDQNTIFVVDYKTGKFKKKKTDLLEGGRFIQIPLYMLALGIQYPDHDIQGEIHHVTPLGVEIAVKVTLEMLKDAMPELKTLARKLTTQIQDHSFVPNPGPQQLHCRQCDYQNICGPYLMSSVSNKPGS